MDYQEVLWLRENGITIDLFAGGGGMSIGMERALQRPVDIALNHDRYAVTLHAANHPKTVHLCQDIYEANPVTAIKGRPVFWIHGSPSCTQFSRSRRALPAEKQLREMAWKIIDWVDVGKPVIVTIENVAEFVSWGPLGEDGFPIEEQKGETWNAFVSTLKTRGYDVEWQILDSADYGAPTQRQRLFMIARRDGITNKWPKYTHGPKAGRPWVAAAEYIDWTKPAPSIFERKKPLAPATIERIRKGIRKFAYDREPYVAPESAAISSLNNAEKVAAFMAQNHSLLPGRSLEIPASTICTKGAGQALVTLSFISVMRNNVIGRDMRDPIGTQTASGGHMAEVRMWARNLSPEEKHLVATLEPVKVQGKLYQIIDIGYRMLGVDELWRLQSFPETYRTKIIANGKMITDETAKRLIGNSVVPAQAYAFSKAILESIDDHNPWKMAA